MTEEDTRKARRVTHHSLVSKDNRNVERLKDGSVKTSRRPNLMLQYVTVSQPIIASENGDVKAIQLQAVQINWTRPLDVANRVLA
ncbi:hypothetical protein J6590_052350 [Homalodisca vitripennis]|nr:hypothetical protein J6590_052350 [Homalodisca vitripennis]